jgi:DNA-binding response OmpR family regulator
MSLMSGPVSARKRELHLSPQPWRWSHPRVLVEDPDEASGLAIASALRYAGYAVGVCPGPGRPGQCPLTGPEGCAPAHEADLVVCSLGYEREAAREVLRELRSHYPHTPLLVEVPRQVDAELRALLDGCHTVTAPATPEQIVAAVERLPGRRGREEGLNGA